MPLARSLHSDRPSIPPTNGAFYLRCDGHHFKLKWQLEKCGTAGRELGEKMFYINICTYKLAEGHFSAVPKARIYPGLHTTEMRSQGGREESPGGCLPHSLFTLVSQGSVGPAAALLLGRHLLKEVPSLTPAQSSGRIKGLAVRCVRHLAICLYVTSQTP